jgi:hypothetical protein
MKWQTASKTKTWNLYFWQNIFKQNNRKIDEVATLANLRKSNKRKYILNFRQILTLLKSKQ